MQLLAIFAAKQGYWQTKPIGNIGIQVAILAIYSTKVNIFLLNQKDIQK